MDIFIAVSIAFPVGIVTGGVLTALYSRKVVNAVQAKLEDFKAEIRGRLK